MAKGLAGTMAKTAPIRIPREHRHAIGDVDDAQEALDEESEARNREGHASRPLRIDAIEDSITEDGVSSTHQMTAGSMASLQYEEDWAE